MPISRLFHAAADAQDAVNRLERAGYERVQLIGGTGAAPGADALRAHGISRTQAEHLAERIAAGGALVIVDAPFGTGADAAAILERAGLSEAEGQMAASAPEFHHVGHDNAAPLSSALGIPVLSHDPAPLSRKLGMPTLSRSQRIGDTSHGFATLSHNPTPLSSAVHMPTLSSKAAPLSSAFGLGVLSRAAAPLSRALGLRVLSSNPAPLSQKLGWRQLSHDPAPLSRILGLKVLLEEKRR